MEIKKEILDKTTKCHKDFNCFVHNNTCCRVTQCINDEVHFVAYKENLNCKYKLHFADQIICMCPTRKEIYNKFGVWF